MFRQPLAHLVSKCPFPVICRPASRPFIRQFGYSSLLSSRAASTGPFCRGESGVKYRLTRPLREPIKGEKPNVWLAVDDSDQGGEYIVKQPSEIQDGSSRNLAAFEHEFEMQRLFIGDPMIRALMDYIPASEPEGPMMVFEPFRKTLWNARTTRAFTTREIKWIMKSILFGLRTIHKKELVYTDLKMENVMLGGFNDLKPNEPVTDLTVKLADCGSIGKPSTREITSLTYRSPEPHFGRPWDQSADIWSWGIILTQLFQAQRNFKRPALYDAIPTNDQEDMAKVYRDHIAIDFNLASVPYYANDYRCSHMLPQPQPEKAYRWAKEMLESGVPSGDVQFIIRVLHPDPNARVTISEILDAGYLG